MIEESEELKKLKATLHPCGHFDVALTEIKIRDAFIASLEDKIKELEAKMAS